MKKAMLAAALVLGAMAAGPVAQAGGVNLGISIGVPGVIIGGPPVYYAPPPPPAYYYGPPAVVVAPGPVYVPGPRYYGWRGPRYYGRHVDARWGRHWNGHGRPRRSRPLASLIAQSAHAHPEFPGIACKELAQILQRLCAEVDPRPCDGKS
ncbi:hypothetical protein CDEF62S_03089 [Castellaniella defragrans]